MNRFNAEDNYILEAVRQITIKYRLNRVVLYGLGEKTRLILENSSELDVAGLMDPNHIGETRWGIPVISIDNVISQGIKSIIIVATNRNVPIIYSRVSEACISNGISVFDINDKIYPDTFLSKHRSYWNTLESLIINEAEKNHYDTIQALFDDRKNETSNFEVAIKNAYDFGYFFAEPLLSFYLEWLKDECEKNGTNYVLFSSRDGEILKKMLDGEEGFLRIPFRYSYFYISRISANILRIRNDEDYYHSVYDLDFEGSPQELLKRRLLLKDNEILARNTGESDENYILRHREIVLKLAEKHRFYYDRYFAGLNVCDDDLGIFDLVSHGNTQDFCERYFEKKLTGYFFLRRCDQRLEHLSIVALFGIYSIYKRNESFYWMFRYIEMFMTSLEQTFYYFDENGPVFANEDRSVEELEDVAEIQRGILDAHMKRINDHIPNYNVNYATSLLEVVYPEVADQGFNLFREHKLFDSFTNRINSLNLMKWIPLKYD